MRRFLPVALAALLMLPAGTFGARAGQDDARLDPLFARLKEANSPGEANAIERQIMSIWVEAGDRAADSLMRLGLTAEEGGDLPGALSLFDAVTLRKPDFAEGWNRRATILYMMGALDKSADDVARVLELEPRHFGALAGLGAIEAQRGRDSAAIAAFEQALRIDPQMPSVKTQLEELKKKRGRSNI